MDHPENATMNVLATVAFPPFETRSSEEAWEQDIVNAVSAAVHADKTLDTLSVRPLDYEDCQWVFESGMPMPDYGVTVARTSRVSNTVCLFSWGERWNAWPGNHPDQARQASHLFGLNRPLVTRPPSRAPPPSRPRRP